MRYTVTAGDRVVYDGEDFAIAFAKWRGYKGAMRQGRAGYPVRLLEDLIVLREAHPPPDTES